MSSDEELVERARGGDRSAFQTLFLAHRAQTGRLLARLVPHNEIEDVAQEVFLQVHRSLQAFRGDSRFSTWLYRLTLNVARMHLRKQKSRPKLQLAGQDETGQLDQPQLDTPQLEAERHERLRALDRLLSRLSDKKREALVLHDFQGVSAEEIAQICEVPVMTVRTRVFYARRELYAALAEEPALAALVEAFVVPQARTKLAPGRNAGAEEASHEPCPKQHALEAYAAELLSPAATARIESHLSDCHVCKQALAAVRAYGLLREEAARSSAPTLDWERLSAALDADAAAKPAARPAARSRGKVVALAWPLLAVAAALMIAWLGRSGAPFQASAPSKPRPSEPLVVATAAVRIGRVSMVVGSVEQALGRERTPVTLASEIREGSTVTTGPNAALHVILANGTGFALGPDSSLRVDQLREDTTLLALASGRLSNQVHKLTPGQRYEIAAGDLTARVRGTRFRVERNAALQVTVHEGKVEVARGDEVLALLLPGESYEAPKPPTPAEQLAPELPVHGVVAFEPDWAALQLPPMAELHAWIIDGARVSTQGDLSMRLPRGAAQLSFEDARGQIRSVQLDLREALTTLEPAALAKLIAPKEARIGYLAPEEIAKVVKAGIDPLRRCYERGLRVVPTLAGKLTLAMRVAADGHVLRADPKAGSELPIEIERCISQEAMRMVFPKPEGGGAVAFEVPLNLKSSR